MNLSRFTPLLLSFAASAAVLSAQTNTFPSSGNVGIGTTSPANPLHLLSTVDPQLKIGYDASKFMTIGVGAYAQPTLTFYNDARIYQSAATAGLVLITNNGPIAFHTDNGESNPRIYISSGGNVGIGTAFPGYQLDVNGTLNAGATTVTTLSVTRGSAGQLASFLSGNSSNSPYLSLGRSSEDMRIQITAVNNDLFTGTVAGDFAANSNSNIWFGTLGNPIIKMTSSGNVGIGTTNPTQKLSVNGTIQAKEVIVQTGWSDFVFDEGYRLPTLSEVEQHIKTEKHLPGIPSAQEVAKEGISLGDMQAKLLAKIEEITLHQIAQEKRMEQLAAENAALRREVESLKQTR